MTMFPKTVTKLGSFLVHVMDPKIQEAARFRSNQTLQQHFTDLHTQKHTRVANQWDELEWKPAASQALMARGGEEVSERDRCSYPLINKR